MTNSRAEFQRRLEDLSLGNNCLTGQIPASEIAGLANLRVLDFSLNALSGRLSSEVGSLSSLLRLNLNCNQLTGAI